MIKKLSKLYSFFVFFLLISTVLFRSLSNRGFEIPNFFFNLQLLILALILIYVIYSIFSFDKSADKPVFVRGLTGDERRETLAKLDKYKSAESRLVTSALVLIFTISTVIYVSQNNIKMTEFIEYVYSWGSIGIIILSVIIVISSLFQVDKKRALNKDLKEGVFSIKGVTRIGIGSINNSVEKVSSLRIGPLELVTKSPDDYQKIGKLTSTDKVNVEYFSGSKRIVKIENI